MKEKEKQLFKALCKFNDPFQNESLLEFATPSVLGHLFFNRMQGIAYDVLEKNKLLGKVNREFRNSLGAAYNQNLLKNQSFQEGVTMISQIITSCNLNIAMLKGAYLCLHYPNGYRTSNDIDLLVSPKDVTILGKMLSSAGFKQGNIINNTFVPAKRENIIESKFMRGETVPYIKEVNLPFMKFFEVDINFSLEYKNGSIDILNDMLSNICTIKEKETFIPSLSEEDFFIHLCSHLYKEATTLPWIEMRRDMTLYKYCDIYMLLSEITDKKLKQIFERAEKLGLEKICAYAILETMGLFDIDNTFAWHISHMVLENDPDFCIRVISPKDNKVLLYQTRNVTERFFMETRKKDLKEVLV